jgi:hypothetical protein
VIPAVSWLALVLVFAALGFSAWRWKLLLAALARLGFAGVFFGAALPFFLLASCAVAAAVIFHASFKGYRLRLLAGLLLLWYGSAALTERYLRASWDFPSRTLAEAAGLPPAWQAARMSVAVLVDGSKPGENSRMEERVLAVGGVDASPESLERIRAYLEGMGFRSLFNREGLAALRRGWAQGWEADKALEAASLAVPGLVVPDYLLALGLLRAGPVTSQRRQILDGLQATALLVKGGFEDVGRAQSIFEAFSVVCGRFSDPERSLYWLGRVDDLWPLYEKRIEPPPVETMRDGVVIGKLLIDGRAASSVRVGLFLETGGQAAQLDGSVFPDRRGGFAFRGLAPGTYHLELMGTPSQVRGRIQNSPGLIEVFEGHREVLLAPIRLRAL